MIIQLALNPIKVHARLKSINHQNSSVDIAMEILKVAVLFSLFLSAYSQDVSSLGEAKLHSSLCTSEAVLYSDCGYQLVVGKVKKGTESSFQNVKGMRALGIYVPQGCKATLYNEKRHFAAHLTGPKKYCSTGQLDGIDIVGLQDVADVALVAGELAKAEDTIKELNKDMKLMKREITTKLVKNIRAVRDGLLRKIDHIQLTPGPTGPRGLRGLSVTGATGVAGPRGLRGFTGATGMKGNRGVRGVAGERGIRGREGKVGPRGDKGTSVQGPRRTIEAKRLIYDGVDCVQEEKKGRGESD